VLLLTETLLNQWVQSVTETVNPLTNIDRNLVPVLYKTKKGLAQIDLTPWIHYNAEGGTRTPTRQPSL